MSRKIKDPYDQSHIAVRMIWGSTRFLLFGGVIILFFTGLMIVYARWNQAAQGSRITLAAGDPNLSATESLFLQAYLGLNRTLLQESVGVGSTPVDFEVSVGQNANQIAIRLSQSGILDPNKEALFLNYLRFYGLDAQLDAGTFTLSPSMDMETLAQSLITGASGEITLTFLEGWRAEQIALYLATVQPAEINAGEFMDLVRRNLPLDTSSYLFLNGLAPTDSLEGFLFPDSYRVPTDANAAFLVDLMLQRFDERVSAEMRQQFGTNGLSIRDAVIVASLVEREAVLPEDREPIASVFLNRITQGIKLDADPTVQYAVGFDAESDSWWKVPLTVTDLQTDSPYNTYLYTGMPPGPIANPGLAALQAVATPAETDFVYFVAGCIPDNPNQHQFSVTYDEHLAIVESCP